MKLTLSIESGNAAVTEDGSEQEIARLLDVAAQHVRDGNREGHLRDYNGNLVGHWQFDAEDVDERSPAEQSAAAYLRYANLPTQHEDHLCDEDVNDSYSLTGTAYMLEGGGPTVWFYMVKDNNGQEDFGVIEHSHHETTYAVLPQHQAEVIDLALRTPREG